MLGKRRAVTVSVSSVDINSMNGTDYAVARSKAKEKICKTMLERAGPYGKCNMPML